MKYSIIIPVYNRPEETKELLESLSKQTFQDFEILVVEDGSTVRCKDVVTTFQERLNLLYLEKPNSGPGESRNYGVAHSHGEYIIVLDSDVVLPPSYLSEVDAELKREDADAFGGPDRAHESFSPTQKAINYAMTSFFTTGGIRGGKKKMDKFYPRSFNMGIRRETYLRLGGFGKMRFGEDIDFSLRLYEAGCRCRLFPEAWVWHKRRTDLRKFFRQVSNSGIARIHLMKRHPGSLKLVHALPAVFTIGTLFLCALAILSMILGATSFAFISISPLILFSALIFTHASIQNKSFLVGCISIGASFVQLLGYGSGFIFALWRCCILRKGEFEVFHDTFYK